MEQCDADELLKDTKVIKTEARENILRIILSSERPLTANELHLMVRGTGTDLATVYRVLKVFVDKGIARTVHADSSHVFYERSCEHNPLHPHFYCEKCGRLECLSPYGFDESVKLMSMAKGRDVHSVEIIFKGRCDKCAG